MGFNFFSADLKSCDVIPNLYFGAPMYVISTFDSPSFFMTSSKVFLIISTPFDLLLEISRIPTG